MVDYSKWDKLVVSSDEEEEEEEEEAVGQGQQHQAQEGTEQRPKAQQTYTECTEPAVYRVGPSGSLTIPGRNVTIHNQPRITEISTEEAAFMSQSAKDRSSDSSGSSRRSGGAKALPPPSSREDVKKLAERRDVPLEADVASLTRNGGKTAEYFWSQTQGSVRISFAVPRAVRAKEVQLSVNDREGTLSLAIPSASVSLQKPLFGPIAQVAEPEDLDWTLATVCLPAPKEKQERETGSQREPEQQLEEVRLLHVDLQKKDLGGLVLWWKSAFKGDAEIDTNALADRTKKRATQSATFMDNFKKAQQMFVERVRNKEGPQPVELDFGDDDDDDNDDSDSGGGCGDKEE